MESPCTNCEFKAQSKHKCTDIKNYCKKLLNFQNKLDRKDHSIKSTHYDPELPYFLGSRRSNLRHDFD